MTNPHSEPLFREPGLRAATDLTTDGHAMYETAVRAAFDWDEVHWAMLVKQYGQIEGGEDAGGTARPSARGRSSCARSDGRTRS